MFLLRVGLMDFKFGKIFQRRAPKLRRAEEEFIPQSTRADSFRRGLGGVPLTACPSFVTQRYVP